MFHLPQDLSSSTLRIKLLRHLNFQDLFFPLCDLSQKLFGEMSGSKFQKFIFIIAPVYLIKLSSFED